ncbi:MAG: hypothetical protein Q3980_01045 [Turicibacter sp.]|nr:hypothetical protein [Turicibacter sp.]
MIHFNALTLSDIGYNVDQPVPDVIVNDLLKQLNSISGITCYKDTLIELDKKIYEVLKSRGFVWDQRDVFHACRLWKNEGFKHSVDFYNETLKIAIEVEKSEVKRIHHDILKLLNGSMTFIPKVKYGVLIYPEYTIVSRKPRNFHKVVMNDMNFYFRKVLEGTGLKDVILIRYIIS